MSRHRQSTAGFVLGKDSHRHLQRRSMKATITRKHRLANFRSEHFLPEGEPEFCPRPGSPACRRMPPAGGEEPSGSLGLTPVPTRSSCTAPAVLRPRNSLLVFRSPWAGTGSEPWGQQLCSDDLALNIFVTTWRTCRATIETCYFPLSLSQTASRHFPHDYHRPP
jgi:hypothetical protein